MIEITDLNHAALVVRDMTAARHFYCDILGMEVGADSVLRLLQDWGCDFAA
jgi:catechol 2,3-dioxygenase-like lactoylglutathione lyase family enzyme